MRESATDPIQLSIDSKGGDKFDAIAQSILALRESATKLPEFQVPDAREYQSYFDKLDENLGRVDKKLDDSRKKVDDQGVAYSYMGRRAAMSLAQIANSLGQVNSTAGAVGGVAANLMAGFAMGGGAGMGLAAVTSGINLLVAGLSYVDPEVKKVTDSLSQLASKDDAAVTLARISGATKEQASEAWQAAAGNSAYASELERLARVNTQGVLQKALRAGPEADLMGGFSDALQKSAVGVAGLGVGISQFLIPTLSEGEMGFLNLGRAAEISREFMRGTPAEIDRSRLAAEAFQFAVSDVGPAINDYNQRVLQMQAAASGAVTELSNYREAILSLGEAHARTSAQFAKDALKIDVNIGKQRGKIEEQLLESIGELEERQLGQRTEVYYRYQKSVIDGQTQIEQRARESAQEQADIYRQLQVTRQNLDRDFGMRIDEAKTEREAAKLRRDLDIQGSDANRKANDDSGRVSQQLDNFMQASETRRRAMDEEYNHNTQLREKDDTDTISKLQRRAQQQRDELSTRRADEMTALGERMQAENAAYNVSVSKANAAHTTRMTQITDMSTAQEKFAKNMATLGATSWGGFITGADTFKNKMQEVVDKMILLDYWMRRAEGREKVAYASNLTPEQIFEMMKNGQWQ